MKPSEIREVEDLVNATRRNPPIETNIMGSDAARRKAPWRCFGEKYDERVRVLEHGRFLYRTVRRYHASRTCDIVVYSVLESLSPAPQRHSSY